MKTCVNPPCSQLLAPYAMSKYCAVCLPAHRRGFWLGLLFGMAFAIGALASLGSC